MSDQGTRWLAGAAGVIGALGLIALYRSLAEGHMGVAAPVSAVVAAGADVTLDDLAAERDAGVPKVRRLDDVA